jgi:hypothetical protein
LSDEKIEMGIQEIVECLDFANVVVVKAAAAA